MGSQGQLTGYEPFIVHPYRYGTLDNIKIYAAETEAQEDGKTTGQRFNNHIEDHTCLHRVYNGAAYILEAIEKPLKRDTVNKKLMENMGDPFLGMLSFDAFVNPQLYSSICDTIEADKKNSLNTIANKIVYFNYDSVYAPVAGIYAKSYITKSFNNVKKALQFDPTKDISQNNKITKKRLSALCFNSDYQKLLTHLKKIETSSEYSFGFITTKFSGQGSHGGGIVVNKTKDTTSFIMFDGANIGLSDYGGRNWFLRPLQFLDTLITEPALLEEAISYYCTLIKPLSPQKPNKTTFQKIISLFHNAQAIEHTDNCMNNNTPIPHANNVHQAFQTAVSIFSKSQGDRVPCSNNDLFLFSLTSNTNPETYALTCADIIAEKDNIYLTEDLDARDSAVDIAKRIVYLPLIKHNGQQVFGKNSNFQQLISNITCFKTTGSFAIVTGSGSDPLVVLHVSDKVAYSNPDVPVEEELFSFFTDIIEDTSFTEKIITQSLEQHLSPTMVTLTINELYNRESRLDKLYRYSPLNRTFLKRASLLTIFTLTILYILQYDFKTIPLPI